MKTGGLIVVGTYVLGFVGMFMVALMDLWHLGSTMYVMEQSLYRALLWPWEVLKMFL